jgi:3-phosphoshikimate 1-carboxyvinyltransferase
MQLYGLSTADDTRIMAELLAASGLRRYDAGAAGTTFRFLTAYLAFQPGEQELTGSARMLERPIGLLVDALRQLGANIDYLGNEGYPPLRLGTPLHNDGGELTIRADVSSQFVSALLLVAPYFRHGLTLHLAGEQVSAPYLNMTLALMQYFGAQIKQVEGGTIRVEPRPYTSRDLHVEADWSAASYYLAHAALAKGDVNLQLKGLSAESWQGDRAGALLAGQFGVSVVATPDGILLQKQAGAKLPSRWEQDFVEIPDLMQTFVVLCAGAGVAGRFSGWSTLRIKETDRLNALQEELRAFGVEFEQEDEHPDFFSCRGKVMQPTNDHCILTYKDHRMAMAFSALAQELGQVCISDPGVVGKSYPNFWKDLNTLGLKAHFF